MSDKTYNGLCHAVIDSFPPEQMKYLLGVLLQCAVQYNDKTDSSFALEFIGRLRFICKMFDIDMLEFMEDIDV